MSNINSEASCYLSACCQDENDSSSSVIKREFAVPSQPPKAAFSCEYCEKRFNLKQYLINHVLQIHVDTCLSVKSEQHLSKFVMAPLVNNLPHEETTASSTTYPHLLGVLQRAFHPTQQHLHAFVQPKRNQP
eukprot:42099_1